jgi:hypothetical protein
MSGTEEMKADDAAVETSERQSFDEFAKKLSDSQLAIAKATIDAVATERQAPKFAAMTDQEISDYIYECDKKRGKA